MALKLPHTGATKRLNLLELIHLLSFVRHILKHPKTGFQPPLQSPQIWAAQDFDVTHIRNLVCSVMMSELDETGNYQRASYSHLRVD